MREIKFRAWLTLSDYDDDGNDKDYFAMAEKLSVHHDGSIGFSLEEAQSMFTEDVVQRALDNGNIWEYEEWCHWEGPFELMQYTGLKDKNGVEIYEGDVVRFFDSPVEGHAAAYDVQVEYRSGAFYPVCEMPTETECEVIGNIYENPELLDDN